MSDIILMTENYPLLLTLTLNEKAFAHFDAMRRRFFPPHRNKVPAHITLFHTLPGAQTDSVSALLEQTAAARKAFPMRTNGLMFLGGGVAYTVESPDAQALRAELAGHWLEFLTPQDKNRPFHPHITVQNRVKGDEAKALHEELLHDFQPFAMTATGMDMWLYKDGLWEHCRQFTFPA